MTGKDVEGDIAPNERLCYGPEAGRTAADAPLVASSSRRTDEWCSWPQAGSDDRVARVGTAAELSCRSLAPLAIEPAAGALHAPANTGFHHCASVRLKATCRSAQRQPERDSGHRAGDLELHGWFMLGTGAQEVGLPKFGTHHSAQDASRSPTNGRW